MQTPAVKALPSANAVRRLARLVPVGSRPVSAGSFIDSLERPATVELCWQSVAALERRRARTEPGDVWATAMTAHRVTELLRSILASHMAQEESRVISLALGLVVVRLWSQHPDVVSAFLVLRACETTSQLQSDCVKEIRALLGEGRCSIGFLESVAYLVLCGIRLPGLLQLSERDGAQFLQGALLIELRRQRRLAAWMRWPAERLNRTARLMGLAARPEHGLRPRTPRIPLP